MEVINAIEGLMLDRLNYDFVKSVWEEEFTKFTALPDDYLEHINNYGINILNEIIEAVDEWQTEVGDISEDTEQKTWKELSELNLNHEALLTVLWYFIENGLKNNNIGSKYASLKAATLYFKLLSISGSRVYHAFHPYLCLKTLSVLKYVHLIAHKNKKFKKKIPQLSSDTPGREFFDTHLDGKESISLIKELIKTLDALKIFVNKFTLQSDHELLEGIIEGLVETTRLEVNTSNFMTYNINNSNVDRVLSSLTYNAYETLKLLCVPQHGMIEDTVIIIMKHLLTSLLLSDHELTFREQCIVREHTVHFVKYLISILGEVAFKGATLLLHNIFTKIGERAEVRQKGKESIVDIMQTLPNKQYTDLVKWLFDCAHCDKASYRVLALEIIAQLLYEVPLRPHNKNVTRNIRDIDSESASNDTEIEDSNDTIPCSNPPSAVNDILLHKYMLAVIFARFRDSSANVRTKALTVLVQCMKSDNMVVTSLMNEIFVLNQQSESSEKGILSYKQLKALLSKINDVNPLPSAGIILSELQSMTCDSKVYVRKAAMQALENIMKLNRSWLTGNILKVSYYHF